MGRKRRRAEEGHPLVDSLVHCPVRDADVDVERCLACPDLDALANVDGTTLVYCRPVSTPRTVFGAFGLERPGND